MWQKLLVLLIMAFHADIFLVMSSHPKCSNLVADLVVILNIGQMTIENRTLVHSMIGQFPIGADLRLSLVTMSAECQTLIKLQDGISYDAVLQASDKPYLPSWGADYVSCFKKVGKMDLREYSNRILIILAFIDKPPSNPVEEVKKVIKELRDQEDVYIFVVSTNKKFKSANQGIFADQMFFELNGKGNVDYGKITSTIAAKVCDGVCSARKSRADECAWNDGKTLCVEKMKWEPLDKAHPACENFKSVEKERPCPTKKCQDLCDSFQWGPWDECCGDTINETYAIRRKRNVSDYARHPDFCNEEEVALCIVNDACWKAFDMIIKRGETRFMAYVICLIFVIILAFIGATILCTSRKRSHRKLERRLRAAGICTSLKDMAKDENLRDAMRKMPLLASFVRADENGEKESLSDESSKSESNAVKRGNR